MKRIVPFLCIIALAACSQEPAAEKPPDAPVAASPELTPLSLQDMESVNLVGELSCSFEQQGEAGTFLVAAADVNDAARADGVMKLGAGIVPLRGLDTGGFNPMVHGARLRGDGVEAAVAVTSDTPQDDSESPPLPAELSLVREGRELQKIAGEWACGP